MTENLRVTGKQETPSRRAPDLPPVERDSALIGNLRSVIDSSLGTLLSEGTRCALMDFPNSGNVGDAAIWMGERTWLERAGIEVVYSCDRYTYSATRLKKELKDGVILWHGGGNLGDLWPAAQAFRERVVSEFLDNAIVQFPQSIWFTNPDNARRAIESLNRHESLHLLIRDSSSLERARAMFSASSSLCPDMAFALELETPSWAPVTDVLWLCRTDLEAAAGDDQPLPDEVLTMDWLSDTPRELRRPVATYAGYATNRVLATLIRRWPRRLPAPGRSLSSMHAWRARQRMRRGCRTLAQGRVVVTNRLHAHIFCCMLAVPHVVVGDRYGKLRAFYDTWTNGFASAAFAESHAQAWSLAQQLAEERTRP